MTEPIRFQLDSLIYLPMDGDRLRSPEKVRVNLQRLRRSDNVLLTVNPLMRDSYLVTLYRAYLPSRKIPADVEAGVAAFNADPDAGWRALIADYAQQEAERLRLVAERAEDAAQRLDRVAAANTR